MRFKKIVVSEVMECFGFQPHSCYFSDVFLKNRLGVISPLSLFRYHDFSLVLCCSMELTYTRMNSSTRKPYYRLDVISPLSLLVLLRNAVTPLVTKHKVSHKAGGFSFYSLSIKIERPFFVTRFGRSD